MYPHYDGIMPSRFRERPNGENQEGLQPYRTLGLTYSRTVRAGNLLFIAGSTARGTWTQESVQRF